MRESSHEGASLERAFDRPLRDVYNLEYQDLDMRRFTTVMPLGSFLIRTFVYPAGLVKTRMQAQATTHVIGAHDPELYRSTRHAFSSIIKNEGFFSLYKGFGVSLATLPLGMFYLNVMELTKSIISDPQRGILSKESIFIPFVAGFTASAAAQTIGVPVDVISQRLMIQRDHSLTLPNKAQPPSKGFVNIVKDLYRIEGFRGFYRGYLASLLTFAPQSAIIWSIYTNGRSWIRNNFPKSPLQDFNIVGYWNLHEAMISAFCGAVSGMSAALLMNPFDVVRTLQQVESERIRYTDTIKKIYSTRNLKGFFTGATARMMSMGPTSMLLLSSYEILKQISIKE